jgi:6-phosphogluconolactonase
LDDSILDKLTQSIVESLSSRINLNGHASIVVCGGNSPLPLYNNLSKRDLDWSKVTIFLGDDRVVPEDHADSNNYLIHHNLLINNAASASFHSLTDLKISIEDIKRPFDVVILGFGK